jgi:hypothetical protein
MGFANNTYINRCKFVSPIFNEQCPSEAHINCKIENKVLHITEDYCLHHKQVLDAGSYQGIISKRTDEYPSMPARDNLTYLKAMLEGLKEKEEEGN